ncbi:SDR family oxidoreductase [Alkanindiges illinoisensis]|uniref:Peroxisomal trans-2-enoyl-CoA reductase n=1 Tax=Alkanindiges illinoisensis TaxID=197183 RepID=A0A4Y7XGM1_9GAMM|nr:SDR family oxidoreductase [Alkanindiges illinoisensis]TEU30872.1 SDR family oxidoreductase [Alkanindiges illinoisensis]
MSYHSIFRHDAFLDKVIMVTGGGSGIGRATAHELASLGAQVIITGRKPEKLDSVVREITEDGGKAIGLICDIRDETQVKDTFTKVIEQFGKLDGLVNNAGGQFPSSLEDISYNGFDAVIRNNLHGTFLMMREAYNQYMKKHGGSIVNMTADMWGGMPGMGHSGAARSGVDNLTKTASVEWGKSGVRVNAVSPGWIMSSGMDTYQGDFAKFVIPSLAGNVPLKRMGTESEVSSAICYLLSEAAAFVSGVTLRIDGAASLGTRMYPLSDAKNSHSYNGFHRAFIPDVLKSQEEPGNPEENPTQDLQTQENQTQERQA